MKKPKPQPRCKCGKFLVLDTKINLCYPCIVSGQEPEVEQEIGRDNLIHFLNKTKVLSWKKKI